MKKYRQFIVLFFGILLWVGCAAGPAAKSNDVLRHGGVRPNIILIMADDLGYECLGCNGSTSYKTPELDKLAGTGMRFRHCYSTPLCTPSRVQIMSGQYNFRNYTRFGRMDPKITTFVHILGSAGYATCIAGKWQLSGRPKLDGSFPEKAGFDEHCLWQVERRESRYWAPIIQQNGKIRDDLKDKYGPDVFCEYINDFIERHRKKSFFVYFPMTLTHSPFVPTPDSTGNDPKRKSDKKYFADMVAYTDKIIGRIVGKVDELGLRDNTLIIFTGDNGSPRGIVTKMKSRTVKGGKGQTTDAGTRAPLVANWKGVIRSAKVCDDLIDFTDFMPTLAEVAEAEIPQRIKLDGRSFLPQLLGKKGNPRQWVFCHYDPNPGKGKRKPTRYVHDQRWKLYHDGRLYDLKADVLEKSPFKPDKDTQAAAAARKRLQPVLDAMEKESRMPSRNTPKNKK
ncbi:MAG: sulfatase-like hydrolase/transferase [Planctomycetota bacterium]|jgi:arylsulfatase A-like enzyme